MAINIMNDGIPFEKDLDITPDHERYEVIVISQGTHKGTYLKFNLYQNGTEYIIPTGLNYRYFIDGKRPDGVYILREADVISGNSLIFKNISHDITDVVGDITLKLAWQNLNDGLINYLAEDIPVKIKKNDLYTSNATTTDEFSIMMDVLGNANTLFNLGTNTTMDTNITDVGVGVDARQMNPNIDGSIAEKINNNTVKINNTANYLNNNLSYISVKLYGAKGDGVTDDTQAIQNCLNENTFVFFPKGTYNVNKLKLRSNTNLLSDRAVLHNISDNVTFTGDSDGSVGGYDALHDIIIDGFVFTSARDRTITYVGIAHATNVTVQNCEFKNDASWHMIEYNAIKNGKIINCYFHAYYGGSTSEMIQLDFMGAENYFPWYGPWDNTVCDGIIIDGCLFDNIEGKNTGTEILIGSGIGNHSDGAPPRNVIIQNNLFRNLEYGINFSTIHDSIIQNNIFESVREGIKLKKCIGNTIINNDIRCVQLGSNQYRGIRVEGSNCTTKIINNRVSGTESYSITCEGLNNVIEGNICDVTDGMGIFYIGFREAKVVYRNNTEIGDRGAYSARATCYVNLVYEAEYENVAKEIQIFNNAFTSLQIDNPLSGNSIHSIVIANNNIKKNDYMTDNKTKGNTTWINNIVSNAISENFNTN